MIPQRVVDSLYDVEALLLLSAVGLDVTRASIWEEVSVTCRQDSDAIRLMYFTDNLALAHIRMLRKWCAPCRGSLSSKTASVCKPCMRTLPCFFKVTYNEATRRFFLTSSEMKSLPYESKKNPHNRFNGAMRLYDFRDVSALALKRFDSVQGFMLRWSQKQVRSHETKRRNEEVSRCRKMGVVLVQDS